MLVVMEVEEVEEVSMFLVTVFSPSVTVCSLCLMAGQCCPNRSCLLTFCSVGAVPSQLMLSCGPERTTP